MTSVTSKTNSTTILKAAWIIAVVTIFSKALGFIRDIIVANFYGATTVSDAYFYAYQIPALAVILLGGVGGPFHSATVAVFSKRSRNVILKAYVPDLYKVYGTLQGVPLRTN